MVTSNLFSKLLIGGAKGHVATFDWQTGKLGCEFHVKETIKDIAWLHNRDYIAVAQKKVSFNFMPLTLSCFLYCKIIS